MKVYEPSSENELNEVFDCYPGIHFAYRGLSNINFELTASLKYLNNDNNDFDTLLEQYKIDLSKFENCETPIYVKDKKTRELDKTFNFRHEGYPSPLMDWTIHREVAIYFATENSTSENSSVIYIFNLSGIILLTSSYNTFYEDLNKFNCNEGVSFAFANPPLLINKMSKLSKNSLRRSRQFGRFLIQKNNFWAVDIKEISHPLNYHLVAKIILSTELKKLILYNPRYSSEFLLPI